MKEATMLYRAPGPHQFNDGSYDYIIVDADEVEAHLEKGWFRTSAEAKAAHDEAKLKEQADKQPALTPNDNAPATRAELEAKATELGLKFDGRTGDKKLGEMIESKLKEQA